MPHLHELVGHVQPACLQLPVPHTEEARVLTTHVPQVSNLRGAGGGGDVPQVSHLCGAGRGGGDVPLVSHLCGGGVGRACVRVRVCCVCATGGG